MPLLEYSIVECVIISSAEAGRKEERQGEKQRSARWQLHTSCSHHSLYHPSLTPLPHHSFPAPAPPKGIDRVTYKNHPYS